METIKKNAYCFLSYFLMRSLFVGVATYNIFNIVKQDSCFSIIIGFLISFIPLLIYYHLLNHNPNLNINNLILTYCGNIIGKILISFFILFFLFHTSVILWNLCNFINTQYLFQTPLLAIAIFFMIPVIYIVNKGLKVIGRCGIVFFLMSLFLLILIVFSLTFKINFNNLFPILEVGLKPILNGSFTNIVYNILPIFVLLIIPKNNIEDNKKLTKSFLKIYSFTFLTLLLTIFFTLTIFGIDLANLYQFPEYHLLKVINVANFFQRMESILSFQWLFDLVMTLIIFIYYIKTSIKETFNFKYNKILIIIISLIVVIISRNIFKNNTLAYQFLGGLYRYICLLFLLIIPLIILIISKLKKKINR